MKKINKLVIFGTGEIAELAYYYFTHDSDYEVVAFCADDGYVERKEFLNLPLVKLSEVQSKYPPESFHAHVALSYTKLNQNRKDTYDAMKTLGYFLASYICSKSFYWGDLKIGDNCFILENQTIQPTVTIGNNVMIWSGNHLGHGCVIKDHNYISSHVCISGHVVIDECCFLGVNAAIKDFTKIGKRVFVTMGANVISDIDDDSVVLAGKGTTLDPAADLTKKIRSKYFNL